jgi:DNA mismatch repair protein PMS2
MKGLARILSFDREGRLVDDQGGPKMVARQRGTTVSLQKLFHPLPVRRKEFERNAKKEFAKALSMLTSYGLVPCAGGWGGDEDEKEEGGAQRKGVRLIVDGVNKTG